MPSGYSFEPLEYRGVELAVSGSSSAHLDLEPASRSVRVSGRYDTATCIEKVFVPS